MLDGVAANLGIRLRSVDEDTQLAALDEFDKRYSDYKLEGSLSPDGLATIHSKILPILARSLQAAASHELIFAIASTLRTTSFQVQDPLNPSFDKYLPMRQSIEFGRDDENPIVLTVKVIVEKLSSEVISSLPPFGNPTFSLLTDTVRCFGAGARHYAILNSHFIHDPMQRRAAVGAYSIGNASPQRRMCPEITQATLVALDLLSSSPHPVDWESLCDLAFVFEKVVPRNSLKSAFVRIWQKTDGVSQENIEYVLRRCGFTRLWFWWV